MKFEGKPAKMELPAAQQTEKLFGHCFALSRIEDSDIVPVGGDMLTQEANISVIVDFKNMAPFFKDADILRDSVNIEPLATWLREQNIEIEASIFATLWAFSRTLSKTYPENPSRTTTRREVYLTGNSTPALSQLFTKNSAECAEIAILAKEYLTQKGVPSIYISGDVLWNRDDEFSEEHSFLLIESNGKKYNTTLQTRPTLHRAYFQVFTQQPIHFMNPCNKNEKHFHLLRIF